MGLEIDGLVGQAKEITSGEIPGTANRSAVWRLHLRPWAQVRHFPWYTK